jgi:hypothetical protein
MKNNRIPGVGVPIIGMDKPVFPAKCSIINRAGKEVTVTLHIDGTVTGQIDEYIEAAAGFKGSAGSLTVVIWLLIAEIRRQQFNEEQYVEETGVEMIDDPE